MRFLVNLINRKEVRKPPMVKFPDSLLEDWEAKARKGSKYRAPVSSALVRFPNIQEQVGWGT